MSRAVSPSTGKSYGLAVVCRIWRVARSTVYFHRFQESNPRQYRKRGPKGFFDDTTIVENIKSFLKESPFHGEGYRKMWAKLRFAGIRTSKRRVLRLMRENGLLTMQRLIPQLGKKKHDGTITTQQPDVMWGTDMTMSRTRKEGNNCIFVAVDHCTAECIGIHASKSGNRFEALEPIRQGVRERFGGFGTDVATGLSVRHDHGSAYMSDDFQNELSFLGIASSPAFVREPEGNGCAERFIRTLKENLLWIKTFDTIEELRLALLEFQKVYNQSWMIEKHGYLSPSRAKENFTYGQKEVA